MKSKAPGNIERIVDDLDAVVEHDAPIGRGWTWYGIGGCADTFVRPGTLEALVTLVKRCHETQTPVRVLGSGANLLVADEGVDGVVVHLDQGVFRESSTLHRHRPNRAGVEGLAQDGMRLMAGGALEPIVMSTALAGMSGLEMMAGIPASIGGAVRMNAGGKYGEISQAVTAVGTLTIAGKPVVYRREEIEFGYRRCSIADPVILWVEVALTPEDPQKTHARVKEYFAYKKKSQPMAERSAGCVFQNPADPNNSERRLSAGRLIDQAGLKGCAVGNAQISQKHANFFTASKDASAADVLALIELAQQRVADATGVELHRELVVWKRRGPGDSA